MIVAFVEVDQSEMWEELDLQRHKLIVIFSGGCLALMIVLSLILNNLL